MPGGCWGFLSVFVCVCVVVSFSVSLHAHSYCLIVEFLAMFSPEFWLEILNPTSWNINFKTSLCNLRKRMVVKSILNCFMHSSGRFLWEVGACIEEKERERQKVLGCQKWGVYREIWRCLGKAKVHPRLWAVLYACCHSPSQHTAARTFFLLSVKYRFILHTFSFYDIDRFIITPNFEKYTFKVTETLTTYIFGQIALKVTTLLRKCIEHMFYAH